MACPRRARTTRPGAGCRHRGGASREQPCPSCRGDVRLKVFARALHGKCTVARALAGVACCTLCPDYDPGTPDGGDPAPSNPPAPG